MKFVFSLFAIFLSVQSLALECPKTTLYCQVVDAMNSRVLATQSVKYSEVNKDEPSEAVNECAAQVFFSSKVIGSKSDLVATLRSENLYLHAQVQGSANDPQFMVSPALNQVVTLFDGLRRLECTLR